jgi:hypothetical protein
MASNPPNRKRKKNNNQFSSFFKPIMGKPMTTSLLHLRVIKKNT